MDTMMIRSVLLVLTAGLIGCGPGGPQVDDSQDADKYAATIKNLVIDHANLAARSKEPGDFMDPIISELEHTDRPSAPHQAVYDDLRAKAEAIRAACEASGRPPADLAKRLDALKKTAEQLPGAVTVKPPPEDG